MILDSSALVGIVLREPGFETLVGKAARAEALAVGASTLTEAGVVLTARLGRDGTRSPPGPSPRVERGDRRLRIPRDRADGRPSG
jgi:uncharacterized protein with PIN domain